MADRSRTVQPVLVTQMSTYKDVLVHYLTRGGEYGEAQEAEQAVDDLLDAAADRAIDRLREDGLVK